MKYTAEEVRKSANWLYQWERDWLYQWERKAGVRNVRAMLIAYAERIAADEGAVAIWQYRHTSDARWLDCDELDADAWKQTGLHEVRKLFTHPPAQAAQCDASPGRCKACGRATRAVCDGLDGNGLGCTNATSIALAAIREGIAELREQPFMDMDGDKRGALADKLEAAIKVVAP